MYNILYFHGLDSQLSEDKKNILQRFGKVISPLVDYREVADINKVVEQYAENIIADIHFVIGSSMGGLVAYHVSEKYNVPCLLFNPAFCHNSLGWVEQSIISLSNKRTSIAYIVLGKNDDVIMYEDNVKFIEKHIHQPKALITENDMGHQIPVYFFEKYVERFFSGISKDSDKRI